MKKNYYYAILAFTMIFYILYMWQGKIAYAEVPDKFTIVQYSTDGLTQSNIEIDLEIYNPSQYYYIFNKTTGHILAVIKKTVTYIYPNDDYDKFTTLYVKDYSDDVFYYNQGVKDTSNTGSQLFLDKYNYVSSDNVLFNGYNPSNRNGWTVGDTILEKKIDTSLWKNGMTFDLKTLILTKDGVEVKPENQIKIPTQYLQMNMRYTMPYYIYLQMPNSAKYFVCSSENFYVNSDGNIHKSADSYFFYTYDNGVTWQDGGYNGSLTKLLGGIPKSYVLYNKADIYGTNVNDTNSNNTLVANSKTTVIEIPANPIPDLETNAYTYEFKSTIENVEGLTIAKDAMFSTSWGLVVGQSKTDYNIKWNPPATSGLYLEISVESTFGTLTRRYNKQTYRKAWTGVSQSRITPEAAKMEVNIQMLGTELLNKLWNDIDTKGYISIPPTKLYYRYVALDNTAGKAYYGNWTRLIFKSGSNGLVETVKDKVTSTETVNGDGTVTYTDTTIDGNTTEYIDSTGSTVSEEQSFTGAVDTMNSALDSSTGAIKNVGAWLGQVPALVGQLFVFIPEEVIAFIGLSFVLLMILKIAGR